MGHTRRRGCGISFARRRHLFKRGLRRFGGAPYGWLGFGGRISRKALLPTAAAAATPSTPGASAGCFLFLLGFCRRGSTRSFLSGHIRRRFFRRRTILPWFLPALPGTRSALLGNLLRLPPTAAVHAMGMPHLARRLAGSAGRSLLELVGLFLVIELHEVGDVQERIALQAKVDKCRLHAGQNPCHASVVNGTRESILVFAFVVDFRELIVF